MQESAVIKRTPFVDRGGQLSPDGRWMAFCSNESSRHEVYVTPFPKAGAKWRASESGGYQPRWSPDGRHLYYVSADSTLMETTIEVRADRLEMTGTRPMFRMNYYEGPRGWAMWAYDVMPRGDRFLINSPGDAGMARVVLLTNWESESRK